MQASIELESSLTDRYQTTVPAAVRKALKLGKRDKLRFSVQPDGAVILSRISNEKPADPVLGHFLNFLASDISSHPEKLQSFSRPWLKNLKTLSKGVNFDISKPLSPEDE